ncbi:hypothetical protein GLOTRDRAFT_127862 [Gloeophyllum trabeum ATCC 11539]|uniref:Uncharacterized protein n=1 Tax=Gloeophyllum trabeum (strain ATCC 11539 / FP-39264 / Madison 617) TaxID=670483 RepID=S7RW48_GLOTA|nr:uncharacterized protein GLOTRDRAFT_127862 [Gloeophyllum trabeum ATCC 11539]EPQ57509.1 hypothetical protein GLOTRDRAFT_127862 [Gloeophyllum trabeum ATCC 11539]
MIHRNPPIIAESPVLDGYNSAACSVFEFPLPPPPGPPKLRHQESLVAISSRALLPGKRQGRRTLGVDWDAASDWSWDAESCISAKPGRTLRNKASNNTLSLPPQAVSDNAPSNSGRYRITCPAPPAFVQSQALAPVVSEQARRTAPSRTGQAFLFASSSMPEKTLGDRTSFLQLDDDSPPLDYNPPLFTARPRPIIPSARLAPSSSMPEMKGGVLAGVDDVFRADDMPKSQLRPNRRTMMPVDPENRCSAFDRLEASIAQLRMHAPSPSPLGAEEPASAPEPQQRRRKPADRHTYSPATALSQNKPPPPPAQPRTPRTPDAEAMSRAHKSRWRDAPLPVVPPHFGSMLKCTDGPGSGRRPDMRSNPASPSPLAHAPWSIPQTLLPSPQLPAPRHPRASNAGPGKPRMLQRQAPPHIQTPSVPPVLTSFMNMSPEQRIPSEKANQERSAKVKKLLRKASVIGWWKKKGKDKTKEAV